MGKNSDFIKDADQLEFAIFCIENTALKAGVSGEKMYDILAVKSDILRNYIIPNYEILHTQDKNYIVNDIMDIVREMGINI